MDKIIGENLLELKNFCLRNWNTLRINSFCSTMYFPLNKKGLQEIFNVRKITESKLIVIGKGSNILLTKDFYDETYIFINLSFMNNIEYINDFCKIEAGATLNQFVWAALEKGYVGNEFLEDIPGTIGGALIMNAGTYRNYIGDMVVEIEYFDIDTDQFINHKVDKTDFGKRKSFLAEKNIIIISALIKLVKGNEIESISRISNIKKDRFNKQPREFPNAGSVFVRPNINLENKVVWQIIDDAGFRGFSINDAMVSDKHPGFIINKGNASANDMLSLINTIKNKIQDLYNIDLQLEWKLV